MNDRSTTSVAADLDRRGFLRGALALPLLGSSARAFAEDAPSHPGLILREAQPENLEFPFASLDSFLTPTDRFYVRNHFDVPKLDTRDWRLKVEGTVERPLTLSLDELKGMPNSTITALLECAGNGRGFLVPKAKGVGWGLGAVGNAEWTGVPLAAVLERAGVSDKAVEVILEGADRGEVRDEPKSPGAIPFARSLPLSKARTDDVLLAFAMNGKELTPSHGFPLRAVVAGWYGMASVKWLTRLVAVDRPFRGYFQTLDYTHWVRRAGLPSLVPIDEVQVKASIARPALREVIPAGKPFRIHGAAWTGDSEVTKVEVSTDGGQSWSEAKLIDKSNRHAWRPWELPWNTPARPGRHVLMARATDAKGRTQPPKHDPDRRHYMISHVIPIEVVVR